MARLKFYAMERELFKAETAFRLTDDCARKLLKQLCRHYHLKSITVDFPRRERNGNFWSEELCISLPHNASLELVCHEFAHYLEQVNGKHKVKYHTKLFLSTLKKVIKYANKYLPSSFRLIGYMRRVLLMNCQRLLCLAPLAYIIWWFYTLFAWLIPSLSSPISEIVNATWWGIISVILFLVGGIIVLVIAFIAFFIILLV